VKYINNIRLFFIFSFFLFLSCFVWDYIKIGLHPHEDFLKFFLFIVISLLPTYFYLNKYKLANYKFSEILYLNFSSKKYEPITNILYFFLIFLIVLSFLSFEPKDFFYLDIYHDGFILTPSMNFLLSKKILSGSFIEAGLFPNFKSLLAFFFIKKITIGSTIFIKYIFFFLNKILLITLAFKITKELNFSKKSKNIFFIFFSIALLTLIDTSDTSYFKERHFLYLVFILLIFVNFAPKNKLMSIASSFSLGSIAFLSLFWWLDIFLFINFLLFSYCIFLYIRNESSKLIYVIFGYFFCLVIFFFFFPKNEIIYFLENFYFVMTRANEFSSISYPSPLFGGDGRATKTLIFFSYSGLLLMLITLKKNTNLTNKLKIFLFFLFLASLVSFLFGLGRSDSYHIITSACLLMFNLIFYHLYFFFSFIKKIIFFKKKIIYLPIIFLTLIFFSINELNFKKINNILIFNKNIKNFILADDVFFLHGKNFNYLKLITYYNKLLDHNECVQVLSDETIIPYLVKRKTCTKFFFYQILVDKKKQIDFINELKNNNPRFILYKSDLFPFVGFFERLKLVDQFVNQNYEFYEKFHYWTFYKLKQTY